MDRELARRLRRLVTYLDRLHALGRAKLDRDASGALVLACAGCDICRIYLPALAVLLERLDPRAGDT